jgi:hypothetical protein
MADILAFLATRPELAGINQKWVAPREPTSQAPAYWFNGSYTLDLIRDIETLSSKCHQLEGARDFGKLALYYQEIQGLAQELRERATYFETQKANA